MHGVSNINCNTIVQKFIINRTVKQYIKHHPWQIIEDGFTPEYNRISESIFSLGNGKIGQRGNFEEYFSGDSLQGNYLSGVYYPDKTRVGWWKNGYPEYFAKVLNAPDWTGIKITINNIKIDPAKLEISGFKRILDMKNGFFFKTYIAELGNGKKLQIESTRFLSMVNDELGAIKYSIKPLNFSGKAKLTLPINADIKNEDANYDEKFWIEIDKCSSRKQPFLIAETKKTHFRVCYAMKNLVYIGDEEYLPKDIVTCEQDKYISHTCTIPLKENSLTTIYKFASVTSSMYHKYKDLKNSAFKNLELATKMGFETLLQEHSKAWEEKWQQGDIIIEGDVAAQQGIRYNIFQLNQTYTGKDERLNVGPKGFTGEKYGGSTYWDTEAYCLPFFLSTSEEVVSRNLLKYRYKHLQKAIENAEKLGFTGKAALFPMVTMNGEECHNEWEITFEEIHRNGAIAYAIFNYIRYTGDEKYLAEYGLEVLIAISRFWAQRVNYSEEKQKYVMLGVTGPNEYENNVNNNWYTNTIACWTIQYTIDSIHFVKENYPENINTIFASTDFKESEEIHLWRSIIENMYFPIDKKRKIFLQQDGFLDKELIPVHKLNLKTRPLNKYWSWDRILRSCYIKQADVLQGLYFFEDNYDIETIRRNYDFYEPLTVHESSLSPCIHSILAAKLGDKERAYEFYLSSSRLDLDDYNSDTNEGLHITSMGGTWMSIVYGFGGMRIKNGMLSFSPFVPEKWKTFAFKIYFRKHIIKIFVNKHLIKITNESETEIPLLLYGKEYTIQGSDVLEIKPS